MNSRVYEPSRPARLGRRPQPAGEVGRELASGQAPPPRARRRARLVHAALGAEAEDVLGLDHGHDRRGGEREPDQRPVRLGLAHAVAVERRVGARPRLGRRALVPAAHRVVVVRARVRDPVLHVDLGAVHAARVVEAELQHDHARVAEAVAQALDRRGDDPEVLGDQGERAELRGSRRRTPRAPARAASGPTARDGRARAPPSRRRSRGNGRRGRGRRGRTCAAGARPTSGSRGAAAPASRRAGCPTAAPCR